jgi:hypothetical protein
VLRRGAHRGGGPARLGLDRQLDALRERPVERAIGSADDHDAPGAGRQRCAHGPLDQRPPAQIVQHLRDRRAHAGPLPGGEDHDGGRCHPRIVAG